MQDLFNELLDYLSASLFVLEDKPEETNEATLRALWFTAYGTPKSAQQACGEDLPALDETQVGMLKQLCDKRLQGTPLAYITGRQQFMGLELLAGEQALIPRKETELLGYAALKLLNSISQQQEQVVVIDVCTGAGNLPVAYAIHQPGVHAYAADLSPDAISLAKRNVEHHQLQDRVDLKVGDLLDPFHREDIFNTVDLITCNPPYISSAKLETMHSEIRDHEPRLAFDGGPFGVKILYKLVKQAPVYLKEGGWLAFEVGMGQGLSMIKVVEKSGNYSEVQSVKDDAGEIRVVMARVKTANADKS